MANWKVLKGMSKSSSKFVAETLTLETDEKSELLLTAEFKDKTKLQAFLTWREVLKIFFLLSELWVHPNDARLKTVLRFHSRRLELDYLTFYFNHPDKVEGQESYRISVKFEEFENAIKALA